MWINTALNDVIVKDLKLNKLGTTYPAFYRFWLENLAERVSRLFIWNCDPVPAKEIEQRMILQGFAAIAKYKKEGELTAFFGSLNTPTKYRDEFIACNVRCPLWSDNLKINRDVVIIDNNSKRNPIIQLIHYYATLLAHSDVTIIHTLVNARRGGGSMVAGTGKQKDSIAQYYTDIYNGKFGSIYDPGMLGVQTIGNNTETQQGIVELIESKERILKNFYNDIGVRAAFTKRSNTISAEIESDASLLLLNLDDMLNSRKLGCEKVNELFGTNWTVELNPEIDYTEELKAEEESENEADDRADSEDTARPE